MMTGWLVNDKLTCIEGTRTFWHHLLEAVPGLSNRTPGSYDRLAEMVEQAAGIEHPDYIIRNAAYFRALNVPCPVISFVQDILHGAARAQLVDACAASRCVVFNSRYTFAMYPELSECHYAIIPIGTDPAIFKPNPAIESYGGVMWVGSGHSVKGFELAIRLASESNRRWVFVLKDDTTIDLQNATVFRKVPQKLLSDIAMLCSVGVCTSQNETQHLAGIEMGMCGLPLVTTNVGVYYNRNAGPWGRVTSGNWHEEIEAASNLDRDEASRYWRMEGLGLASCMVSWRALVEEVVGAHVQR